MYNNVYIKKSTICNGIGIFANKKFKEGDIITWYYGLIVDNNYRYKYNKYVIEYKSLNMKKYMIGISDIKNIKGKGLAQFANDAIYIKLTGKTNNAYFTQNGRYIFLIASKNIKKHDEILVSYGMNYWIKEINYKYNIKNKFYDCKFKKTIKILYYLTKLIKDYFLCDVYEFIGFKNNYKLYFKIIETKRWCINYNIWHYDEDFYISIKKEKNNLINVYYSCLTCKDNDYNFLIDKTIVNIFELDNH
jgi:hypothetical protein